jgi:hypothetical protein
MTEEEVIREMIKVHNGDEVEFYLGDNCKIPTTCKTVEETVDKIRDMYTNFNNIDMEIQLVEYITSGEYKTY